ncbi:hypothetical protein ACICHK_19115 [Streptomyces sp. AHU1]|uniref:hypothetical protein n=1 Tax=Streptomyces sp. AHU1 TaxID=3377215 RepID=UPI0038778FC5
MVLTATCSGREKQYAGSPLQGLSGTDRVRIVHPYDDGPAPGSQGRALLVLAVAPPCSTARGFGRRSGQPKRPEM